MKPFQDILTKKFQNEIYSYSEFYERNKGLKSFSDWDCEKNFIYKESYSLRIKLPLLIFQKASTEKTPEIPPIPPFSSR